MPRRKYNLETRLRNAVRKEFLYSPLRREAMKRAKRGVDIYECENCHKEWFKRGVDIDHKDPVVDPECGFIGWDNYIIRTFCDIDNLWCLCKECHKEKTREDDALRKKYGTGRYKKKEKK